MAAQLPRPGVEVLQVFRTVSPTVVTPTLVPCIVGVCRQIVDVIVPSASGGSQLNPSALIALPAFFLATAASGSPLAYTGLDAKDLVLSVNNGPDVSVTFVGASNSPLSVVGQIEAAFLSQGVTEAVVERTLDGTSFRVRTIATGEFASLEVRPGTDAEVLAAFGLIVGYIYTGTSLYSQHIEVIPALSFPDPRSNLAELAIEADSVRAFLGLGSGISLRELSRTTSYLRKGGGGSAAALVNALGLNSLAYAKAAMALGSVDIVSNAGTIFGVGGTLDTKVLNYVLNGTSHTITFSAGTTSANSAAMLAALNAQVAGVGVWSIDPVGDFLSLRDLVFGVLTSVIVIQAGSAAAILGLAVATSAGLDGDLASQTLNVTLDDGALVAIAMGAPTVAPRSSSDLLQKINAALGGHFASEFTDLLTITSRTRGKASKVLVGGTAAVTLGFTNTLAQGTAGVVVVDDGNGDAVSPLVAIAGADFTAVGTPAICAGVVDLTTLTYPGDVSGLSLTLAVSGAKPQTLFFDDTSAANAAAVNAAISDFFAMTAELDGDNHLQLTGSGSGEESTVDVLGGTALGVLGLVPSLTGTIDLLTLSPDLTRLNSKKVKFNLGGTAVQHSFGASDFTAASVPSDLVALLNANTAFSALALAYLSNASFLSVRLLLGGSVGGTPRTLQCVPAASAEAGFILGFDPTTSATLAHFEGSGFAPISGDDLYVDGTLVGRITQVAPGGNASRVKINKQLPITDDLGSLFYMIAKNLPGMNRPVPEISVGADGAVTLKANLLRDTSGVPILAAGRASVYLSYHAIREDVTAKAANPGLLRFDSTTQLESILSPSTSTLNPLGLGLYAALLNAPGAQVAGMGVDAISADAPFGTVEAFIRAAEALEQFEVYAIAPLTHDSTVGQIFSAHVAAMSAPALKGERICLFNFDRPSQRLDALVASGLQGNTIGSAGTQFDTGVMSLSSLVLNQGIQPAGVIPTSAGLFLDIASDGKKYSVSSLAGGVITIRTAFSAGENDDGFYATTLLNASPLPSSLINEPFAVRVRGASLTLPGGSLDKAGISETYQSLAQSYMNRRFWSIVPDQAAMTLGGLEQLVDGFYLCAAIAGMIGQQPPQQSFTNFPMTGFTRVVGSSRFFTEQQLNVIAAGGNYIVVQDVENGPVQSRMALTTDMTSIELRTDSIQKVVDFTAKFMRRGLRSYIGRYNITQGFLDSLGHVVQGLLGFLTDLGVLVGANMNNIMQDEASPDTVLIDVTLDVPYPCNYIQLTLVI